MLKSKFSKCFLIVLCLFVSVNVFALTWAELKAQIEAKYSSFSDEVNDMEMVMEAETKAMEGMQGPGPSEIKMFRKGNKYRMEMKMSMPEGAGMPAGMGDMTNIMIFDGKDLWSVNQFAGKTKIEADADAAKGDQMNWWKDMPENGKIIGSEKIGDKDCYVVEAWDIDTSSIKTGEENKIKGWIEKGTLLLIQSEFRGAKDETFKAVNSNFQKVEKWELPYTTEIYTGGKLITKTAIKTLKINQGLSDELFDADKVKVETKGIPGMPGIPGMEGMMEKFKQGQ
ncbi:outer membrane lipoprotein-sorting protein [candidate division WOR-3 bacterium]|nr:outer membrane lipoprotein-sorting protein [candidate division WOR-3 bacterium]